jgi:hypothetical protein
MVENTNRHASLNKDKAEAVLEAYRAEGFIVETDGVERHSNPAVAERVCEVLLNKARVDSKNEIQANAIEPADLTAIVFPSVTNPTSLDWPEADDDSDDAEVTKYVWRQVNSAVSKAAQTGRKGTVQKILAANPDTEGVIVCSTKIGTNPKKAIYVSADKDAIMVGLAMPRTTRLTTLSSEIADDFKFAIEVNASLKKALNDKMETGLKAARDTARAKLALTSGSADEDV